MADIFVGLLEPAIQLGQSIAKPVKRQWNLLCCFNSNVQKLRDEARKLEMARADLQMRVTTEENNARVILHEVEAWLEDVDKIQLKMTGIEGEIRNIQSSSGCLSVKSRYSLSKKVIETTEVMKELLENRNFGVLAQPAPPAAMVPIPLGPMNEFESRKHIEEEIMRYLGDDNINVIGICGMGGVGKTTMAEKVRNRARQKPLFVETVIAVVGQKVDMLKIQQEIADQLGLELKEKTLYPRANKLRTRLSGGKRILIVLDDVWKELRLDELGIPCEKGCNCTILLTSRNRNVINKMDAQKVCKVPTLSEEEAWSLFKEKVGTCVDNQDLLSIAQDIAKECKGLPIALVTVGVALRNKEKPIWKDARQQLKGADPEDMPKVLEDVYKPLKLSYDAMESQNARSIFLLCCLFPEDSDIPVDDLTFYCWGLGMFGRIRYLEDARYRICTLVDMLKSRFLLLEGRDENYAKMHDVIRDVAIFIASNEGLVDPNLSFLNRRREHPYSNCIWISSTLTGRAELPKGLDFPNLCLLRIEINAEEKFEISDNFFEGMVKLKVLSIEFCDSLRSLPDTIRLLENLRTLILEGCESLKSISVVGELLSLEVLICRRCHSLQDLPVEMGRLTRLKLIEFSQCGNLETIAPGVLSRMVELEELKIKEGFDKWEAEGNEGKKRKNAGLRELESLTNLTRLEIKVADYTLVAEQIHLSPKIEKFDIEFGNVRYQHYYPTMGLHNNLKLVLRGEISLGDWINVQLLRNTEYLHSEGDGSNKLDLAKAQNMRSLCLRDCSTMKKLVNITTLMDTTTVVFPHLKSLELDCLPNLEETCNTNGPDQGSSNSTFPNLKELTLQRLPVLKHLRKLVCQNVVSNLSSVEIHECDSLHNLFLLATAKDCLFQLESLTVVGCKMMEQVVLWNQEENKKDTIESRFHITFPKLKRLELKDLPNLSVFYEGMGSIEFPLLTEMEITNCPNLKSLVSATCSIECGNNQYNSGGIRHDHDDDDSLHLFCGLEKVTFGSLKTFSLSGYSTTLTLWCHQIPDEFFTGLGDIMIENCGSIRSLFSSSIAQNLINLRKLRIRNCCEMVNVIEEDEEEKDACGGETTRLFPNLKMLHLECLSKLKSFCEWRYALELPSLEEVRIEDCPEMERYSLGSLTTPNLKNIHIKNVGIANTIRLNDVRQVEVLEFRSCQIMEQVVVLSLNEEENEKGIGKSRRRHQTTFPKLKRLSLWNLPNLTTFCKGVESIEFPLLTKIEITDCTKLKSFVPTTCSSGCENNQNNLGGISHDEDDVDPSHLFCNPKVVFGSLKELHINKYNSSTLWCDQIPIEFFSGLKELEVVDCGNIRSLSSSLIAQNLVNLQKLSIWDCHEIIKVIEEEEEEKDACGGETSLFPNLDWLYLWGLPKLKSFCHWECALKLESLKWVYINNCPQMERFSLGFVTTPNLESICINHKDIFKIKDLNGTLQQQYLFIVEGQFSVEQASLAPAASSKSGFSVEHASASLSVAASSEVTTCYEGEEESSPKKKTGEISTKVEDSVYDLERSKDLTQRVPRPHHDRCIEHCSLFSPDREFEKDKLVQMWIAEDCIELEVTERMEDIANLYFDALVDEEVIIPSKFDNLYRRMKYKVNTSKASTRLLKGGNYVRIEVGKSDEIPREVLHLTWQCKTLDRTSSDALKNFKQLRTLVVLEDYGTLIEQLPGDIFLGLKLLRTLDFSCTHISELPGSIGLLESLRYLDTSETPIKRLPESMDRLHFLQTLKLKGCFGLLALPKGLGRLINLRHLELDIVGQLKSMPRGMGNLIKLQTLQAFLVGKNDGCGIEELKNMNEITGSFCISRLENVSSVEEAREAALGDKKYIDKLELRWLDDVNDDSQDTAEILECLQPHFRLRELQLTFYSGSKLPSWISNPSFTDLFSITLYKCINCDILPSLGELPSLKILHIVDMNNVKNIDSGLCRNHGTQGLIAFRMLEKLTLDNMLNLEEWTGIEDGDFPCLRHVSIRYCPKLCFLPCLSHFSSLQHLEICHCVQLTSLPELPDSLESLIIRGCPQINDRCVKDEGPDWSKIASVRNIWIDFEKISLD